MVKIKILIPVVLIFILPLISQTRKEIRVPDIKGFKTMIGDFHIHTLYSDGQVWPTIRVEEAFRGGLDVIALTEHVETDYKTHTDDIPIKYNRSYELALPRAIQLGILLVKATEITRNMPPGHFNALFIKDEQPMKEKDPFKAIELAVNQGAFIIWTHPGWGAQLKKDKVVRWYDEHTKLYERGWINGIEVVNWDEYYPEVFDWALNKKLTMFGNSDIHTRIDYKFNPLKGQHRPYTLIFSREWTLKGVREAFEKQRTLIYDRHFIMGREELLEPFFKKCIKLDNRKLSSNKHGKVLVRITNLTDIPVFLETDGETVSYTVSRKIHILPHTTETLALTFKKEVRTGKYSIDLPVVVSNFLKNPREGLKTSLKIEVFNNRMNN